MATIAGNSFPTEFNFIDNPIMVGVTNLSFPSSSTFRQAMVKVDVTFIAGGTSGSTYYFYADASVDATVWLDVSSALRAAMNAGQPGVEQLSFGSGNAFSYTYPYATFGVTVYEKYLLGGNVYEVKGTSRSGAYAYYGGLTEYERMTLNAHVADFYTKILFTRKPLSGELRAAGDISTSSAYDPQTKKISTSGTVISESAGRLERGEGVQILFINSLGVFESATAFPHESLSYGLESERKNLVSAPQYKTNPVTTTHKSGGRAKFEMSSGFVSREWADWWCTEFLKAKRYWMLYTSGIWVPVTVTPTDDTILIYDRSEQRLSHVDFEVEVAAGGSIINQTRR